METPILKNIPVKDLKPAAYNPRKKLKPGDKEYEKIKNCRFRKKRMPAPLRRSGIPVRPA